MLTESEMSEFERLSSEVQKPTLGEMVGKHAQTISRLRDAMTLASARLQTSSHRPEAMRAARLVLDQALIETT